MGMLIGMPSKNIYVSEEDMELFNEAAEIAGGLSPAISRALRTFVETERRKASGLEEIAVRVDEGGVKMTKRFLGRRLLKHKEQHDGSLIVTEIFRTSRNQFAVYRRFIPTWTYSGAWPYWDEAGSYDYSVVKRSLAVYPTREEMEEELSPSQREAYQRAATGGLDEFLDI